MNMFDSTNVTDKFLDEKRKKTDPLADQIMHEIITSGNHAQFIKTLKALVRNNSYSEHQFDLFPIEIQQKLNEYFKTTSTLPEWLDWKLIQLGQDVFNRYVLLIMMMLQYKSLPLCYSCKNGAKILHLTGRLTERYGSSKIFKRLAETGQMVANTMSPGSFLPNGKGIVTIQKVRLIHAMVRYFLQSTKYNTYEWDTDELGAPINQEDLTGTLMAFAPMIIDGLEQLNIKLTKQEKEGYIHCWKVIGYLNGIDHDLLPNTYNEAWELSIKILKHQAAPSAEGIELTKSCIDLHKNLTRGFLSKNIPEFMVRYFLKETSEATGLDIGETIGIKNSHNNHEKKIVLLSKFASISTVNKCFLIAYHKFQNISFKKNLSVPNSINSG
ncbi:oxygenase MpaB family protein [Aquimarina algiphila]|uniref:DUF2236 domain-containing protein n=1 Tax=Aquimarina algiphila TaxID=2047982 RepID=A0A554VIL4_9FLAO|nr:oxygenase MpaB family protein [Aquimarina algiphila]TSE07654.1 DUF2236 domain-containing protein [Aquimarina algiphila]